MKILFLSHYFPPEVNAPATRTYEHCKKWVAEGNEVTVVTCAPNHPHGKVYEGYKNSLISREKVDGIDVIRLWTYVTANEGFFKRTLNYVSFMFACILALPWLSKADVVITTSPQFFNGLAGYPVSRLMRIPWVLEIRDLWPESILTVGAIKNKTIIKILEFLEIFAYKKASHIVPVTDSFKEIMLGKGIGSEKITVIKNGVDLDFFKQDQAISNEVADQVKSLDLDFLENKFVASYVGTHGMAHHLETVLEAAEILNGEKEIVFLLAGGGAEREKLLALKQSKGLDNVIMLGQQTKTMMPYLWQISDVSLVLLKKSDLFKTVIPSKIFESMAMQKPIVMGVEGEARSIIETANSGICIEPENSRMLAEAIKSLYRNQSQVISYGENGREFVSKFFDRKKLALKYLDVIKSVV